MLSKNKSLNLEHLQDGIRILSPGLMRQEKITERGGDIFLWMKKRSKISSKGLQFGGWGGDKKEMLLRKERLRERRVLEAQRTSFPRWESPVVSKTADWSGKQGVTPKWPLPLPNRGPWWPYTSCLCREVGWNLIGMHWREEEATADSSEIVLQSLAPGTGSSGKGWKKMWVIRK